ncbi:metal ABC transporter substrate-binding protein [Oscillospiraceae bacterium MB08-C2-2]|nr:metal ABC transporter substrate-binding protein [Oscillospiraceae bacterium MB08-C2-2]
MVLKRFLSILAAGLVFLTGVGCKGADQPPEQSDKLSVCVSFYPMYDFAAKIGGEHVSLTNLVPAGTEPHDWEPRPADIAALEKADVFIYNGAGMEHWVDGVLDALSTEKLVIVETSHGLTQATEQKDEHSDEEEDDHGGLDPHVWLDPVLVKEQAVAIRDAFVKADPEHQADYESNYQTFVGQLDELDQEFRKTLEPLPGKDIVVAHAAFGYLCRRYGLNQVAAEGFSPDSEPGPAQLSKLISYAREHQIRVIFFEELTSPKVAEVIAREIGAETAVLNPLEGLTPEQEAAGEDYFSVMRRNLEALKLALE